VAITESKIGFSVVDKKAMEFVAAKVAASSGDARKYIELVTKSIQNCLMKLSLTKQELPLTKPVVTIKEAMMAIRETNIKYKDIIQNLTTSEKVALCAGVHLARKFDGEGATMRMIRDLTMVAMGFENDVSLEDFKGVLERLQDSGLLLIGLEDKRKLSSMKMVDLLNHPFRFDLQLEDVESALEDTVMKEGFYQKLVDRVKNLKR
jgi:Cdc6-like AAA superfamily ATPase